MAPIIPHKITYFNKEISRSNVNLLGIFNLFLEKKCGIHLRNNNLPKANLNNCNPKLYPKTKVCKLCCALALIPFSCCRENSRIRHLYL